MLKLVIEQRIKWPIPPSLLCEKAPADSFSAIGMTCKSRT